MVASSLFQSTAELESEWNTLSVIGKRSVKFSLKLLYVCIEYAFLTKYVFDLLLDIYQSQKPIHKVKVCFTVCEPLVKEKAVYKSSLKMEKRLPQG